MLCDTDAAFTKAIGLVADLAAFGLHDRSERYAMVVDDGVVQKIDVEKVRLRPRWHQCRLLAAELTGMCSERHLSSAAAWAAADSVRPDWLCRAAGMDDGVRGGGRGHRRLTGTRSVRLCCCQRSTQSPQSQGRNHEYLVPRFHRRTPRARVLAGHVLARQRVVGRLDRFSRQGSATSAWRHNAGA